MGQAEERDRMDLVGFCEENIVEKPAVSFVKTDGCRLFLLQSV